MKKVVDVLQEDDFSIETIKVSSEKQLLEISRFIIKNFNHNNDKSSHIRNYRLLIEFLNAKGYVINELDADILMSKSNSLRLMIKSIIDLNITPNKLIEGLIEVYKSEQEDNDFIKKTNVNKNELDVTEIYYNEIKSYRVLKREEEIELFKRYQQGDTLAFDKLVEHNLRLVFKVSRMYLGLGISFEDLIQEGNIILMDTIKKFDINQGYKFSTYFMSRAKWVLSRKVKSTNRLIRLPVYYYDDLIKLKKVIEQNLEYLDRLNETEKEEYLEKITCFSKEKIKDLKCHLLDVESYDRIIKDNNCEYGNDTYEYYLVDKDCCVEDEVISGINFIEIFRFIKNTSILTEDEKKVLYLRYVLRKSLKAIGKIMNVRDESVRQKEKKAFRKLKKSFDFRQYVSDEYLNIEENILNNRRYNKVY